MNSLQTIFDNNNRWAKKMTDDNPNFFHDLAKEQHPKYFWIGCADSRVPENEIMCLPPGDIFVHRNIANVIGYTDLNALSVLHYAVDVLKVKHVIVCGHYGCGGVKAALGHTENPLINNWVRHVRDVKRFHETELEALESEQEKFDRLCELNVLEQVQNVRNTYIVKETLKKGQELKIHGLIYNLDDGLLTALDVE